VEGPSGVGAPEGNKSKGDKMPNSPINLSPVGSHPPTPTCNSQEKATKKESLRGFLPGLRKSSQIGAGDRPKSSSRRRDRTSKMLLAVLALFLITELPQGIMAFLSGLYGQEFFRKCYNSFAEVWDILALINSAINFILYCFMSKQFRTQFRNVFKLRNSCLQPKTKWTQILFFHQTTRKETITVV